MTNHCKTLELAVVKKTTPYRLVVLEISHSENIRQPVKANGKAAGLDGGLVQDVKHRLVVPTVQGKNLHLDLSGR